MAYDDYIWIYDVGRQCKPTRYHAYRRPGDVRAQPSEIRSACGNVTTKTYGTKLPGAPDCEECLAVTGPNTSEEPEGDLVVPHSLEE